MEPPPTPKKVRVVCISDTHNKHRQITVPDGDILIHGGDFSNFGNLDQIKDFNDWLGTLPHPTKLVISGNHENGILRATPLRPMLTNAVSLYDQEAVTANGLVIYGTKFFWPCPHGNPHYDLIPQGIDILISHGPPKGYFDCGSGCPALLEKVKLLKPRLHVFGHIHGGHGTGKGEGDYSTTQFVNAAMVIGEEKKFEGRAPIVVDL